MIPLILAAVIFGVPTVTSTAAVVTGKQQAFCQTALGGTYEPTKDNICPGGEWSRVYTYLWETRSQPKSK